MTNSNNIRYQTETEYENENEIKREIVTVMTENCV